MKLGTSAFLAVSLEAAKVSETTCTGYSGCGFLHALCSLTVQCFPSVLGIPNSPPCKCSCKSGRVEVDVQKEVRGITYDSYCQLETACDTYEATLSGGSCGEHSYCSETSGSPACLCEENFQNWVTGSGCSRGDVCDGVICVTEHSDCFDDAGVASCACENNYAAWDIDPTSQKYMKLTPGVFTPDNANAACVSARGCFDVNCGEFQTCAVIDSELGLPQEFCECDRGYITATTVRNRVLYNGGIPDMVCENLDECSSHLFNKCSTGERCVDSDGTYSCICDRGYISDPDSNECVCDGPDTLGDRCIQIPEFTSCDLMDSVVSCDPQRVSIHFPKCAFDVNFIPELYLSAIDSISSAAETHAKCQPFINAKDDTVSFVVDGDLTACGMAHENNGTHLIYQNAVHIQEDEYVGIIRRRKETIVDFACTFTESLLASQDKGIYGVSSSTDIVLPEMMGVATIMIDAYEDENFQKQITIDSVIRTPAPIYVRVWLHEMSKFNIHLDKCWATAQPNGDSTPMYEFISDGCGLQEELDNLTLDIIRSGAYGMAIFKLDSFTWSGLSDSQIHIHCNVELCDPNAGYCGETCNDGVNLRRRRHTDEMSGIHRMSSGPIYIQKHYMEFRSNTGQIPTHM